MYWKINSYGTSPLPIFLNTVLIRKSIFYTYFYQVYDILHNFLDYVYMDDIYIFFQAGSSFSSISQCHISAHVSFYMENVIYPLPSSLTPIPVSAQMHHSAQPFLTIPELGHFVLQVPICTSIILIKKYCVVKLLLAKFFLNRKNETFLILLSPWPTKVPDINQMLHCYLQALKSCHCD